VGLCGCGAGFGGAEGGVALVAHLLDLGGAFGVEGHGGWRGLVLQGQELAVEGVEGGEVGGQGWEGGCDCFGGWVDLEGEEGECFVHCWGGEEVGGAGGRKRGSGWVGLRERGGDGVIEEGGKGGVCLRAVWSSWQENCGQMGVCSSR